MQIKYRITLVYTVLVTIILLLFSIALYVFSYQDMVARFKERLLNKANSTLELIKSPKFDFELIKTYEIIKAINKSSPSSLYNKSIYIFDYKNDKDFVYNDPKATPIRINDNIVNNVTNGHPYYFKVDNRDAVAIEYVDATSNYIIITAAYDIDRENWLGKLKLILFICLFISVIIIIFTGYIFSLSLIKAITEFTHKIRHISSEKFSLRLDTGKGKDELQKLAITINDLLDRLQASFNLQRRFIDNASHELSTPLAAIASQMDVALQRDRSSDDYKKAMLSINDDIKRLSLLVRSLLEIAKVSGSMGGTELTSVRVDELLMRIPAELKKVSPMYDVNIEFDQLPEDASALIIYGNEHLLYSSIKNIVHNACKFSEDKKASIVLSFTGKSIIIAIHDKGPGIDAHDLEHIFQPFYRSNRHQGYVSGAGLGLPLAQRIIGLHKGTIEVKSKIGKGTTFIITLPIEGVAEPDEEIPARNGRV
ncbi:MAG: HAMP domain-containing histidine kinase [Chitinophagaceae bacterium]|nr:HAMP domain-containing histidine kinase [Chitinophagaceae bacterium]MCB9045183.1 HAMP domain-containing histidine kinase [Chitinophagales bacterium]